MKAITVSPAMYKAAERSVSRGRRYNYFLGCCDHCGKPLSANYVAVPLDSERSFITDRSQAVEIAALGQTCFKNVYGGTPAKTLTGNWPKDMKRTA